MDNWALHQRDVTALQKEFVSALNNESATFSLNNSKHNSNTVRQNCYKKESCQLNIDHISRILKVDVENGIAVVEPRITMDDLVKSLLSYNVVPAVVPEFKSITVGGAINGTALESSSHCHGQFNDSCLSYEVLLGNGTIVIASETENTDLFYGLSGAYGTLGIILSITLRVVPTGGWILTDYQSFDNFDDALAMMGAAHCNSVPPQFIEAIIFDEKRSVVITANDISVDEIPKDVQQIFLRHSWSPWYYQHVKRCSDNKIRRVAMPIYDYLFRQDRAGFWMGGYALNPGLLARYTLELLGCRPHFIKKAFKFKESSHQWKVNYPSGLFRFFFGWMMNSRRLYAFLHHGTEQWFADHFSIQDYYIPDAMVGSFVDYILKKYAIYPIWICPVLPTSSGQILSPHYLPKGESKLMYDVGVYGMAKDRTPGPMLCRNLDMLAVSLGGKKMLYSYSYYTKEEFWSIYSLECYKELRQKYFATKAFPALTDKTLVLNK